MEPEVKSFNWTRLLITLGIVLITALAIGGSTYYVMNSQAKKDKEATDKQVSDLQKQVDDLKKAQTSTNSTTTPSSTNTNTTTPATTTLTNDQIFQEVATKFGLTRNNLGYFRIYGQNKVSYSTTQNGLFGSGPFFAYKVSGTWTLVPGGGSSAVAQCSEFSNIPEQFKPMCYNTAGTLQYADANRSSINYPTSQMVSYIGQ